MASAAMTRPKRPPAPFRSLGRSMLLTLPMALWALLLFTPTLQSPGLNRHIAAIVVILFMTGLFS